MCMGEMADELIDSMMDDPDTLWGGYSHQRNAARRCVFCDTLMYWRNGGWVESLTSKKHNCRVATADEFPD